MFAKPKWRNGRRAGLKIRFTQVSVGSSPTFGIPENKGLTANGRESFFRADSPVPQLSLSAHPGRLSFRGLLGEPAASLHQVGAEMNLSETAFGQKHDGSRLRDGLRFAVAEFL